MGIANILTSVVPGGSLVKIGLGIFGGWLNGRQEAQTQKRELKSAKHTRQVNMIEDDKDKASDLDIIFSEKHGLTQTISFYVFLLPAIMAFIGFEEQVTKGFQALDAMPDWYKIAIGLMIVAVWGFRRLLTTVLQSKIAKFITEKDSVIKQ